MKLTAADDSFGHTSANPQSAPTDTPSTDPRFFERHWNVWHDDTGDLIIATGGSWYPNLGRMETYAIVNHRGEHRSVRAMGTVDTESTSVLERGPIHPQVIDGLRRWRHRVEPGDWGFSFDLMWVDTHRQEYAAAWGPEVHGEERQVTAGFEGFGRLVGWIQFGDKRIHWAPGQAHGTRDRHWGVGRGVGGPALNKGRTHRPGWKGGLWIDLGDVGVWGKRLLYPFEDPRPGAGAVHRIERHLRFEPDTHVFTGGVLDLTLDDGSRRTLNLERIGNQTAYMKCGFYGGTPESGIHHGQYQGADRVEWDFFDVNDPAQRSRLSGLNEHHCRVSGNAVATTGVMQPLEPDVYQACVDGRPGWNLLN
ncbi:hypothetical protein GOPIP_084_00600 [Gordonia polyisoprenivorans NBRC 16320 = JCM 10675]|uniref:Uncharacterized protein n=1 Tax=Gordonia polyisoprenivorans TaxID=84595 RepID=A0A846WSA7_9ACTN|nr:hypothetical protein [Gordonia polyisoprenivorans]NKY04452.1 hypothetical protein [Gordonia polyisoprenivorans]OZC29486.1 hypothetical protein CJJ17_27370 [Gordonia polyisoprenivorans]GAB25477.1 hypothetical protein GOPIP_084_00600 [Gordonia polyisoprenivorans NBRC 16320 = JCM 10675]